MLTTLPKNLTQYKATPCFTTESLPKALQKWHQTKPAVWGRIVLSSGTALYEILIEPPESMELSPGVDGIIKPQQPHRVIPLGDVELQVLFYHKVEEQPAEDKLGNDLPSTEQAGEAP